MKEPVWIDRDVVLAIHDALLHEFGGASGFRDETLLDSALARPENLFLYESPDLFALAAAYMFGIVRNHPFVDGNKRTGLVVGGIFLERNGKVLVASEEETATVILAFAEKKFKEEELTAWLRKNCK
ncbi:MAG: type II toxin-antitoxin system death-on-curing family toxin [Nitrospirae bacterium]|nr:type II toxin-antitoxin system death-on-curing family toxin [Nitrospirota bacterium]MDA1303890.1 type II toxin-antitoxin system death-on-curing family toxin [Nitrospirota bacterium]